MSAQPKSHLASSTVEVFATSLASAEHPFFVRVRGPHDDHFYITMHQFTQDLRNEVQAGGEGYTGLEPETRLYQEYRFDAGEDFGKWTTSLQPI